MGTEVGRIEKEFVFKSLVDENVPCDIHGSRKELRCLFAGITEKGLVMSPLEGKLEGFEPGEEVRVFFYLKNNYHTFASRVREVSREKMVVDQPPGVYKNLQRKFERVRLAGGMDVSFSLHGTKVELNFPKSDRFMPMEPPEESPAFDPKRVEEVLRTFRTRMEPLVSDSVIVMMRDRMPRTWEEKTIVRLGKCLWIPSTAEDFPSNDPFPDEQVITKADLIKLEEESGAQAHVITSKLGNILYEKTKKDILSELWCPVLYNEYVVGYVHIWNTGTHRERLSREIFEYVQEFGRTLCYSLVTNGYFKVALSAERRYEAPIIDMSASGLLFAHTSPDLVRDLVLHADLELTVKLEKRIMLIGSQIRRKFKDAENAYFGVLFMRLKEEDFKTLFRFLYGKPFDPSLEGVWEGGAPPPPIDMS